MENVDWTVGSLIECEVRVHLMARSGVSFTEYENQREQSFKVFTSQDSLPEWVKTKMLLLDTACGGRTKNAVFLPSVGILFPNANIYHIKKGNNDN